MLASLHPPLSAFPLALITVVTLLEIIHIFYRSPNLLYAIRINLALAAVFVIAAFFSGYSASESASQTFQVGDQVIAWHHSWGRLLLFFILPTFILNLISSSAKQNKKVWFGLYYLLLLSCQSLVIYTGYLGGQLVFLHGAGVSATVSLGNP